ncbi:MAG: hypothetical protein JJE25_04495, partial [Bacteroidia bacterium]|nr:hypothetical protein [Bacteroidia bacterium]
MKKIAFGLFSFLFLTASFSFGQNNEENFCGTDMSRFPMPANYDAYRASHYDT